MTSLELHALAHRRPRVRGRRRDPRLLARPRRRRRSVARARPRQGSARPAHRAAARHDARLRGPRGEAQRPHEASSRSPGRRTRSARSSTPRASASSRTAPARSPGSTPSTTPRTSRSTCARSTPTCCSARPTSSAARTSASPTAAPSVLESWRPYKARPAPVSPLGPPLRDRARSPTSCSPASTRRSTTSTEIGGMEEIVPYERALGERFLATLPESVTVYGLPTLEGRVPTFLINVDGVAAEQRRRDARRARHRRLGARQLVLAQPLQAARLRRRTRSASASSTTTRSRRSTASSAS